MVVWFIGSVAFAIMTSVLFHNGLSDDKRPTPAVETVAPIALPRAAATRELQATQLMPAVVDDPEGLEYDPHDEATRVIEPISPLRDE